MHQEVLAITAAQTRDVFVAMTHVDLSFVKVDLITATYALIVSVHSVRTTSRDNARVSVMVQQMLQVPLDVRVTQTMEDPQPINYVLLVILTVEHVLLIQYPTMKNAVFVQQELLSWTTMSLTVRSTACLLYTSPSPRD